MTPLVIRSHPFVVVEMALREPVDDAWTLDAAVRESPTVTPAVDDVASCGPFRGTVVSVTRDGGKLRVRVVGGAGRLASRVATRYQGGPSTLLQTLADLATEAGETPPTAAAGGAYGTAAVDLPTWRVHGGSYRVETQRLATVLGLGWRVAPSGAVDVSEPSWPASSAPGKAVERGPQWVEYDAEVVAAYAGTTVDGVRVGCALSELGGEGGLRVTLFAQLDVPEAPRAEAIRAGVMRAQSGDRLDVELDDGTLLIGLPLWLGVPGLSVELATGARVLVLDLAGDPRQTCAMLAPVAEAPAVAVTWRGDSIVIGGTVPGPTAPPGTFIRVGDIMLFPPAPGPSPVALQPGPHGSVRG